jgi:hypothetical protein
LGAAFVTFCQRIAAGFCVSGQNKFRLDKSALREQP